MSDDRDRREAEELHETLSFSVDQKEEVGAIERALTAARAEGAATLKAAARGVVEAGDIVDDCYPEERKLRAALDALRAALEESP